MRSPPVFREHGIVSLLNVPIAMGGLVWGVLEVDSDRPQHFGKDDADFLLSMSNVPGLALRGRKSIQNTSQEAVNTAVALAAQKVPLREQEHRLKNDFQLIQSLLAMQ